MTDAQVRALRILADAEIDSISAAITAALDERVKLLAACEQFVEWDTNPHPSHDEGPKVSQAIRDAIAKARGEAPA